MFEITVTETVQHRLTINPDDFPEGYNFEEDPHFLLHDYAADQASEGVGFDGVTERDIYIH